MKTFLKKNALFLAALVAVILVIIIMLITYRPTTGYALAPGNLPALVHDSNTVISPMVLFDQLKKNQQGLVLVDIRNTDEYGKGHIGSALNIPVLGLMDKSNLDLFRKLDKQGQTLILYGKDQLQANGPWLFLKQLGFDNLKVLQGGYSVYNSLPLADSLMEKAGNGLWIEKSCVDTLAYKAPKTDILDKKKEVKKISKEKIVPVKKEESAGGGC